MMNGNNGAENNNIDPWKKDDERLLRLVAFIGMAPFIVFAACILATLMVALILGA